MKILKRIICITLSLSLLMVLPACVSDNKMSEKQPEPTGLSVQAKWIHEKRNGDIFVSPLGDDRNNGAKDSPVQSIERAVELARALSKNEKLISFSEGEYKLSNLTLSKEDSGIVFYAENNAVINGGITLDADDFKTYRDNIKMLDLKSYGVTADEIGDVRAFGQFNTSEKYGERGSSYCELFCDNERMTLSRYPNAGEYLKTGEITDNGDSKEIYTKDGTQQIDGWEELKNPRGGTFKADKAVTDRVKSWTASPDIWMFGYFQYDWADSTTPLKEAGDGALTTKYASVYGFKEDMPYYFFNIFEELDAQNEWYIDKESLILYFIPPENFENKTIELSLSTENLITLESAEDIEFDGVTLTGTRANAIKGTGNNIAVKNCTVRNTGEDAVNIEGTHITVQNNTITATGKAGVALKGGDRETLTSSENVVTNNLIHDWSQVYKTYQAAINIDGVGTLCSHNEIYNSPHEAIAYKGNNHIIEYNVIHDVVKESSDAGAIYSGRSWSQYGTVIRYNCIYNIGSGDFKPNGIYFDDALSGQSAYGNLLINIPGDGFLLGGGRDLIIENNILVNTGTPIYYDDRAIEGLKDGGWFGHSKEGGALWQSLEEVNIKSDAWAKAYPTLQNLSNDFNDTDNPQFAPNPAGSSVKNNVIVNNKKSIGEISKKTEKFSNISENTLYKISDKPFSGDSSYILNELPENFEELPLDKIGRTY